MSAPAPEAITPIASSFTVATLADRKLELDVRKLDLEVAQLAAPWWRRPAFLLAALPTVLATLSVVYGLSNGYFQALAIKLENQRSALEADITLFTQQRDAVKRELDQLREQLAAERKARDQSNSSDNYGRYQLHRAEERIKSLEAELLKRGHVVAPRQ